MLARSIRAIWHRAPAVVKTSSRTKGRGQQVEQCMQGVQDVVAFARLVFHQLEIAVEKVEEYLKMWLDFKDFQVISMRFLLPA